MTTVGAVMSTGGTLLVWTHTMVGVPHIHCSTKMTASAQVAMLTARPACTQDQLNRAVGE